MGKGATLALTVVACLAGAGRADNVRATTVGMPARVEQLVLPGPELEAKPLDDPKAPLVLRVLATYPHGTAFRYDLVYYGLEPGTFNLGDYLRRKDGSPTTGLPPIPVTVTPLLPAGQVLPNALRPHPSPRLGGYRTLLIVGGTLWILGLLAILFAGRGRQRASVADLGRPLTLADRLRPLVEKAMRGNLGANERADLERTLLAYWRRRLGLADQKPAETFALLRQHPEAGPLFDQLESWLHRPQPEVPVNLNALLKPYQVVAPSEPPGVTVAGA